MIKPWQKYFIQRLPTSPPGIGFRVITKIMATKHFRLLILSNSFLLIMNWFLKFHNIVSYNWVIFATENSFWSIIKYFSAQIFFWMGSVTRCSVGPETLNGAKLNYGTLWWWDGWQQLGELQPKNSLFSLNLAIVKAQLYVFSFYLHSLTEKSSTLTYCFYCHPDHLLHCYVRIMLCCVGGSGLTSVRWMTTKIIILLSLNIFMHGGNYLLPTRPWCIVATSLSLSLSLPT